MEKIDKSPKNSKLLNNLKLYFAMSLVALLATPKDAFTQTQNNANTTVAQNKNAMSISEYNELLQKREKITKDALDKINHSYENTTDYLEKTQKQIFLNSFSNNKNLVKYNMNQIIDILRQDFKINVGDDPIEILNAALIQISKEEKMQNLSSFTNKISSKKFDIATINAYWYVQANNKNTRKDVNWEFMPTFNITSYWSLETIISILKNWKYNANYNNFSSTQNIKPDNNGNNLGGTININNNESWSIINLDDEKKPTTSKETIRTKEIKKNEEDKNDNEIINLDDVWDITNPNKNDVKKEEIKKKSEKELEKNTQNDNKRNNEIIDLDDDSILNLDNDIKPEKEEINEKPKNEVGNKKMNDILDDDKIMKDNNQQKKLEEIYKNADEETKKDIEKDIKWWDDNKIIDLDKKNNEIINLDEESTETSIIDINEPNQEKQNIDMFVDYDFVNELKQSSPILEQKEKTVKLMKENLVVKDFVEKLEEVWISFKKWDDNNVNRTSAILRNVNWDFEFGYEMLKIVKESNLRWAEAVKSIIFQTWAKELIEDDNLKIVENMSWNEQLLEKSLSKEKINWISYQEIVDVVNWFKSDELKKAFMYWLLNNDVVAAQKVMWMDINCDNRYPDYKASNKIWKTELNKIKKLWQTRKYMNGNEIMANKNIPQDVKDAYKKFVSGEYNNKWKAYIILSKTDFNMYMFSTNHTLLSRQNTLIWMDVWDQKNDPYSGSQTTPGWIYEIWNKFEKSDSGEDFFKKYWTHYIVIIWQQWQSNISDKYTIWIHWTYEKDPSRDIKIKSNNTKDRRGSNGCINLEDLKFWEIINHAKLWSTMFVTYEPSSQDIQKFLANNK